MKQAIIIFLKKDKLLEKIRRIYLPDSNKYEPHITIIYPFQIKNQKELKKHIKDSIKNIKQFEILLKGLKKSAKEFYLYLLVNKGEKNILKLHNNLSKGILRGFENKKMPRYIPHISLGKFKSKKEIDNSIKEISRISPSFKTKIKSIQLVKINNKHEIIKKENFKLPFSKNSPKKSNLS